MNHNIDDLRAKLSQVDYGSGLTRDELRERVELPQDVYIYLPAAKKFLSADDVVNQTGAHALARAEGYGAAPDLDMPTEGAEEDFGPPGYGPSLTGTAETSEGEDDLPGPEDDLGGNSIETSQGRGIPRENR